MVGTVVRSKTFQHWVTQKVAQYFSAELQTKVSIGGFRVDNFTMLHIDSIFIADQVIDTAFYINEFTVDLDRLDWNFDEKEKKINVKYAHIDGALVNFRKYTDTGDWNYEFVINYFDPPRDSTDTIPGRPFILNVKKLELSNSAFAFRSDSVGEVEPNKFNPDDFRFGQLNGTFNRFILVDDSLAFNTKNLTAYEKNGYLIENMKADAHIYSRGLEFYNMQIHRGKSILGHELKMNYNDWDELEDFVHTVEFTAQVSNSTVSMDDVAFWGPGMQDLHQMATLNGKVRGTIDNLKGREIVLEAGTETYLEGDFSIRGLPEFFESYIDVTFDKVHTVDKDIKQLFAIDNLPDGIRKLGQIDFKGNFTGFPKAFVAYGNFNTDLGKLSSDIKIDFSDGETNATYSGYLKTDGFNLGEFVNEAPLLRNIALDAKVEGSGLTIEAIDAEVIGKINTVEFNNYTYKNIEIDGNYAGKLFSGYAKVRDENVELDFDGSVDFKGDIPVMDFVSTIYKSNLLKLGFDTLSSGISGKLHINLTGDRLDNLDGTIGVANVYYRRNARLLQLDTASLWANYADSLRRLKLESNIVDAEISGQYNFSQLGDALYNYAANLLPQIVKKDTGQVANENFRFTVNVKKPYLLTNFLWDDLTVDPFEATGSINTAQNKVQLNVATSQILYKDMAFRKLVVATKTTESGAQKLELSCARYFQGDSLYLENASAALTFEDNNVFFDIDAPQTITRLSAHLQGKVLFTDSLYRLTFENSSINSKERVWIINNESFVGFSPQTSRYTFDNFKISNVYEAILINGAISKDINDTLRIDFDKFSIADINYFTRPPKGQELGGVLNGHAVLFNLLEVPLFTSALYADSLSFGADTLGNLELVANNNRYFKLIQINGGFTKGRLEGSKIKGWVNFDKKAYQNQNITFNLNNATTRFFEPFLEDIASEFKGYFSTSITIKGTFDDVLISGNAHLSKPQFKIDYLQTTYSADTAIITLDNKRISVSPVLLRDENGSIANASGFISHNSFSDFAIDFKVDNMHSFMALNTQEKDNDLYYGTAYMTGSFRMTGPFDDLYMDVKGRSEKGTTFNLKMSDETSVGSYDFITFVDYSNKSDEREPVDLSGIRLNLNLEVTPDADIKIIFDSQLGDVIEGTGRANLRMEINTLGDFKMFGIFEIEKGKYLFTALDLINKKFVIRKGGTITWTGDPVNAQIDISAAYPWRTSVQPLVMGLVPDNQLTNYSSQIPVEAVMGLKGPLMKPEIKFGINIPDLSILKGTDANTSVLYNAVRRVERDQEEASRQVFSLLSLGQFATPIDNGYVATGAENTGTNPGLSVASSTVGNLLSNQITNWLSKYDPKWNIGVQVGQGGAQARAEVILSASRQWLNNRLQLDVSADNTSQGNINVNYKIKPNGNVQARVFGRNTNNPIYNQNILSFGGGFYLRSEFENFDELKRKIAGKKKPKGTVPPPSDIDSTNNTNIGNTFPHP